MGAPFPSGLGGLRPKDSDCRSREHYGQGDDRDNQLRTGIHSVENADCGTNSDKRSDQECDLESHLVKSVLNL